MSLWTPGGERPVPAAPDPVEADEQPDPLAGLTPEARADAEAMAAEMDEVRRQLAGVPAHVVVGNHVMGLYELAAIHLSSAPPAFGEAQLAIDAMAAVVEALEGRLGEHEATLRDALGQMRLAFVQLHAQSPPADGA